MSESLMEQHRVQDDGLRVVNCCCKGRTTKEGNVFSLTVPYQKVTANYVPAAAVIHRSQALSGIIGRKAFAGYLISLKLKARAQLQFALETVKLELQRGQWNSQCSGGMRRYQEEHQWRRRLTGYILTLMNESVGSKQDQIPQQSTP